MSEAWENDYNEELPHDALGDLTPVEYRVLHHPAMDYGCSFGFICELEME